MERGRGLSNRIIAFAAFSMLCYFGAAVIITVLLAVMLAFVLDPFVKLLQRIRIPRSIGIFVMMLMTATLAGGVLSLFVDRAQEFSENLPRYNTKIQKVSRDIRARVRAFQKRSEDIGTSITGPVKETEPVKIQQYSTWRDFFFRDLGPVY
jgi:predicted PurR-regulated permease PerM